MATDNRLDSMCDQFAAVDRTGIGAVATNWRAAGKRPELIPLWVADMALRTVPEVIDAVKQRADRGLFGYTTATPSFSRAVTNWMEQRHAWSVEPDWLIQTPGVVPAIFLAVGALTKPGDRLLIQTPCYPPIRKAVVATGRQLLDNHLIWDGQRYSIDWSDFAAKAAKASAFILCSPHNPVGRVWQEEELATMAEICQRHNLPVIADEIHHDFVYPPNHHTVFASLNTDAAERTITLTAASKTFNLAGLQLANTIIRNSQLRQSFDHQLRMTAGLDSPSVFGLVACQAAYQYGANWLDRLLKHLLNNFQELGQTIDQVFRLVSGSVQADRGQTVLPPEGTYLAWLDLRQLGLEHERLVRWLEDEAGLWLSNGLDYGQAGAGFMRWNVAQPQTVMRQALAQLLNAAQGLAA